MGVCPNFRKDQFGILFGTPSLAKAIYPDVDFWVPQTAVVCAMTSLAAISADQIPSLIHWIHSHSVGDLHLEQVLTDNHRPVCWFLSIPLYLSLSIYICNYIYISLSLYLSIYLPIYLPTYRSI